MNDIFVAVTEKIRYFVDYKIIPPNIGSDIIETLIENLENVPNYTMEFEPHTMMERFTDSEFIIRAFNNLDYYEECDD